MEELKENQEPGTIAPAAAPTATDSATAPVAQPQGCPGNCKMCPMMQQTYCAAQMGRNIQDLVAGLFARVDALADEIAKVKESLAETKLQPEAPLVDAPEPEEKETPKRTRKPAKS